MPDHPASPATLDPAPIAFDDRGHPVSALYGDVYKSRAGAFREAQAVFVAGCRLRERWCASEAFTVLELGFGLGVNFLATLAAWRADPARPARLNFVSVEAHPVAPSDLRRALAALAIDGDDARRLCEAWPLRTPGLHRLRFADDRVTLTLAFGDARRVVPGPQLAADAFYLDGFAPARNPGMWEPVLIKALARLARPDATLATYSAAAGVRDALAAAGFEVHLVPGFGGKRERIDAIYRPRWRTYPPPPPPPRWPARRALVIGAGLSGCHLASTLAARGWRVTLIDRQPRVAAEGSSQPALADHLQVTPDDNPMARLSRAALLHRRTFWSRIDELVAMSGRAVAGEPAGRPARSLANFAAGKLQVADSPAEFERFVAMVERLRFPESFVRAVDTDAASELAGARLARGGLWLPMCGTADPGVACAAAIRRDDDAIAFIGSTAIAALRREDDEWLALDASGVVVARAPVAVLANAGDAVRLGGLASVSLRRLRGQTSTLGSGLLPGLRAVIGGDAYACPLPGGRAVIGSTYDDGDALSPDPQADESNLRRLSRMLAPGALPDPLDSAAVESASVGFRFTARDRLPLVGALPDERAARAMAPDLLRNDRLPIPRLEGLCGAFAFGSRGLLWSAIAAELVADALDGDPMPIERDLIGAVDPARFLRQALRTRRW
jgi:tRNA 5-methylaminomethyl-2-thiouridine biosynthesis bifunctional protein